METIQETAAQGGLTQMISFSLGGEEYGVDIRAVKEVIRIGAITSLPGAASFVKGVLNLRGDVIPIIDLRDKFGLPSSDYTDTSRVIVVDINDKSIGMVVDNVSRVIRIGQDQIDPAPPWLGGLASELLQGVVRLGERLVILLNIEAVLSTDERIALDTMKRD